MNDDTAELLSMFAKMGTTDHDELVRQFQQIISGVDTQMCVFFLEASNWSLQGAILSYLETTGGGNQDFGRQIEILSRPKPNANFVLKDDGVTEYYTDVPFSKVWSVTNNGSIPWPEGASLDFIGGDQLGGPRTIQAPPLPPGTTIDMTINFRTPANAGSYAGSWSMTTNGSHSIVFGEPIWVVVKAIQSPHQTIQAGWGGFGAIPAAQPLFQNQPLYPTQNQQPGADTDMNLG